LQDLELFALLLAAISHDVDHHGFNNAYHKKAKTPLGLLYQDRPVMEMHHIATAIRLLEMPEHNVVEGLETPAEKSHFFDFFIQLILATDIDKHFHFLDEFEAVSKDFDKRNERHRLLLAQIVLNAGNLSNTMRPFDVASDMAHHLADEFFQQGDVEKQLGLEVTLKCDRTTAGHLSAFQASFYEHNAAPLLTALRQLIPALADNCEQLDKNKKMWEQQNAAWEAAQKG
jgi:cAMP-specific phosphodiesterase